MKIKINGKLSGFTLLEIIFASVIFAIICGIVISGYMIVNNRLLWQLESDEAMRSASNKMEQIKSSRWDLQSIPTVDEMVQSNFPYSVDLYITNFVTITILSVKPPLKMLKVDSVWLNRGRLLTNSLWSYKTP